MSLPRSSPTEAPPSARVAGVKPTTAFSIAGKQPLPGDRRTSSRFAPGVPLRTAYAEVLAAHGITSRHEIDPSSRFGKLAYDICALLDGYLPASSPSPPPPPLSPIPSPPVDNDAVADNRVLHPQPPQSQYAGSPRIVSDSANATGNETNASVSGLGVAPLGVSGSSQSSRRNSVGSETSAPSPDLVNDPRERTREFLDELSGTIDGEPPVCPSVFVSSEPCTPSEGGSSHRSVRFAERVQDSGEQPALPKWMTASPPPQLQQVASPPPASAKRMVSSSPPHVTLPAPSAVAVVPEPPPHPRMASPRANAETSLTKPPEQPTAPNSAPAPYTPRRRVPLHRAGRCGSRELQPLEDGPHVDEDLLSATGDGDVRSRTGLSYAGSFHDRAAPSVTTTLVKTMQAGFKVINQYTVLQHLGTGTSGKVKLVESATDGELYAVKIVKRKKLRLATHELHAEALMMISLHHKHIVPLVEVIDDPSADKVYMVMLYMEGGPILEYNRFGQCAVLSEYHIQLQVRQLVGGLCYLHLKGIVHCDIKPDNILKTAEGEVLIADFGSSLFFDATHKKGSAGSGLGSPLFMAPEMFEMSPGILAPAVDIWPLGVIAYSMLFGRHPFWESSPDRLRDAIAHAPLTFPPDANVSAEAHDVVRRLLERDPKKRITLQELRVHPWVRKRFTNPSIGAT